MIAPTPKTEGDNLYDMLGGPRGASTVAMNCDFRQRDTTVPKRYCGRESSTVQTG